MTKVVIFVSLFVASAVLGAVTLMLLVVFVHTHWWPAVPRIGFWPAMFISVLRAFGAGAGAAFKAAVDELFGKKPARSAA